MLHDLVEAGSQLVVATHSAVLLAFPGASIYEFRHDGVETCSWEDLDVVQQVRAFLRCADQFFRYLFD